MTDTIRRVIKYMRFSGGRYRCIVCGKSVRRFFRFSTELENQARSYGFPYDFRRMETLNFEHCNCPFCLSSDRERLYLLYLDQYFKSNPKDYAILDFAPTPAFARHLKKIPFVKYTCCDLFRDDVDLQIDACNMGSVKDETYDIVIFSHVLEHVDSPKKALSEIKRVLKTGGIAIIMVPLFWDVTLTVEDSTHQSVEERWKNYGQFDHVRLYSRKDFLSSLMDAGFRVEEKKRGFLDSAVMEENAIADNSILYVSHKD